MEKRIGASIIITDGNSTEKKSEFQQICSDYFKKLDNLNMELKKLKANRPTLISYLNDTLAPKIQAELQADGFKLSPIQNHLNNIVNIYFTKGPKHEIIGHICIEEFMFDKLGVQPVNEPHDTLEITQETTIQELAAIAKKNIHQ